MTDDNKPKKGEFYILQPDMRRGGPMHGVVIENIKTLLTPPRGILRPEVGGFPPLREAPRLVYDPKRGPPPEDLEGGMSGYWLVSERLRDVFVRTDPHAFEFVPCEFTPGSGNGFHGSKYYLCDVVRVLDALDEESSKLKIKISDEYVKGKFYSLVGGASLAFKKDVLKGAHVFRTPYSGTHVFCDNFIRSSVEEAGIGLGDRSGGLWFSDVFDY